MGCLAVNICVLRPFNVVTFDTGCMFLGKENLRSVDYMKS